MYLDTDTNMSVSVCFI